MSLAEADWEWSQNQCQYKQKRIIVWRNCSHSSNSFTNFFPSFKEFKASLIDDPKKIEEWPDEKIDVAGLFRKMLCDFLSDVDQASSEDLETVVTNPKYESLFIGKKVKMARDD